MNETVAWLLDGPPYVRYRTLLDLLGQAPHDAAVQKARAEMLASPPVRDLLAELHGWPGETITNHKKAGLLYHKLAFLAEIGVTAEDPGVGSILTKISAHVSKDGVLQMPSNIPTVFGGTGKDAWAWILCDAPRLYFALIKMGARSAALLQGMEALKALIMDNGYPCAAAPELNRFRGPGKRGDPCPYATLLMLSALLQTEGGAGSQLRTGAECLLSLWERSREASPYLFRMGTDFRKLKAPFIWYDILHVADVLSQLAWLRGDPRMREIAASIRAKADSQGRYTPESVWLAWKTWDFGQKKLPSPWLTFLALRVLHRFGG